MKEFKERDDIEIGEVFNRRISKHDGDLFSLSFDICQLKAKNDKLNARITVIEKRLNNLIDALIILCIIALCIGLLIYNLL
jgi:hypothetical protein